MNFFFLDSGCIFCQINCFFTDGARRCILYGGWRCSNLPGGSWADDCALTSHSARLGLSANLGLAVVCSALAVLRGVSEEWGTLVVSYSLSRVD